MAALSEPKRLGDVVKFEDDMKLYSRDSIVLIAGQNLLVGSVLGLITLAGATETHAGNTGNGAMTLDVTTPVLAFAEAGIYRVVCTVAAVNGGTFRVYAPRGRVLGDVAVAATFANWIKFVIADGSTDFIVGDTFLVTVAAGSGKATQLAPAALDGSQNAAGVLIEDVDAATVSADKGTTMIARFAIVSDNGLVWPAGISAPNKAAAVSQLQAAGILVRTGA
jgi:Bacteriophage lambda head decoration protein D